MKVFDKYSVYYNLLYQDKNYDAESTYIVELIKDYHPDGKSILDIGCGTGKHAYLMSKHGFNVSGVDLSINMLEQAKNDYPDLTFYNGDARNFELNNDFDIITSLFHVASYQVTDNDLHSYLSTIYKHLAPSGLLLFDFWYGPAVLTHKPEVRIKRMESEDFAITRLAEPVLYINENIVDVNYQILVKNKDSQQLEELNETHRMRYWFIPEIKQALELCNFDYIMSYEWMSKAVPSEDSWGVCVLARKKC